MHHLLLNEADHWVICADMSRNVRKLSMFQSRALNEIRSRLSLAALLQALLNLRNSNNLQLTSNRKILNYCANTTNATKFRKKTRWSLNKGTAHCSDFALSWGKIQDSKIQDKKRCFGQCLSLGTLPRHLFQLHFSDHLAAKFVLLHPLGTSDRCATPELVIVKPFLAVWSLWLIGTLDFQKH